MPLLIELSIIAAFLLLGNSIFYLIQLPVSGSIVGGALGCIAMTAPAILLSCILPFLLLII